MVRGTRILCGDEARQYSRATDALRKYLASLGLDEVILPALWGQDTFVEKAGPEIIGQMYAFNDKKDRPICLIPEATAIIQEMWKSGWRPQGPDRARLFYVARCYRYERPQAGRYREFTQVGVELLGGPAPEDKAEAVSIMRSCLDLLGVRYEVAESVKRGLDYYTEDGFEASAPALGAQKQVAGGGRYDCGVGFAIGLERALLAGAGA